MTMAWTRNIVQMSDAARSSLGGTVAVTGSVLAVVGYFVGPLTMLALLVADACCFPARPFALNETIVQGYRLIPLVLCIVFLLELSLEGSRPPRLWERVVVRMWGIMTACSLALSVVLFWFGVRGPWRDIIEFHWSEEWITFLGLYGTASYTSLFGVAGRVHVWAKELARNNRRHASMGVGVLWWVIVDVGGFLFSAVPNLLSFEMGF